jgi:hypothetical protein
MLNRRRFAAFGDGGGRAIALPVRLRPSPGREYGECNYPIRLIYDDSCNSRG